MRTLALLGLTILSLACSESEETRGARPVSKPAPSTRFDRAHSTALFVGVRTFEDPRLQEVAYAVDDAIDLAYTFAMERNVRLVLPERVVLALEGEAVKEESRERLEQLIKHGACVTRATRGDIRRMLEAQAKNVGPHGLFVAGFASHGFMDEGIPYILSSTSTFGDGEHSLSAAEISEIATTASNRSLILIDACRERVSDSRRGPASGAAPLVQRMASVHGQVVFYAGGFAYDDHTKHNGVFTRAILDCLRCDVHGDAHGIVTAEILVASVEKRMLNWIKRNRDPSAQTATQVQMDIDARTMTLARCVQPPQIHVRTSGSTVIALDESDNELWRRDVGSRIVKADAADLDGDEIHDVIATTANAIAVFDPEGEPLWNAATPSLSAFLTADLFKKKRRQVIARTGVRLAIFDSDGTRMSTYVHTTELRHVIVGKETSLHAPKIIAADAAGQVFALHRKTHKPLWHGRIRPGAPIRALEITDYDGNRRNEITVRTAKGSVTLAFDGHTLRSDGLRFSAD